MMSNGQRLNAKVIAALPMPATNKVHFFGGVKIEGNREVPGGFGVRVTPKGAKSFVLDYRLAGKQRRIVLGQCGQMNVLEAVRRAAELRKQIGNGTDPLAEKAAARARPAATVAPTEKTLNAVLDQFLAEFEREHPRRPRNYESALRLYVRPALGSLPISQVRRRQISDMADAVEEKAGRVSRNRALAYLSSALNWWANRDEDYVVPRFKGLRKKEQARNRVLTDAEIAAVWTVASTPRMGQFGRAVRMLLLTGQRLSDVTGMPYDELHYEPARGHFWVIPAERYKTEVDHSVPLTDDMLELIGEKKSGLVFPPQSGSFLAAGQLKMTFDREIAAAGFTVEPWKLHDLRRTVATKMAARKIPRDHVDYVLGHRVGNDVSRAYNWYTYFDEKRAALEVWASELRRIVSPSDDAKVVPLRSA